MTPGAALVRIHRLEYPFPIHYLCYAVWGACYAGGPVTWPLVLVVVAALIHPVSMSALNGVVDLRDDVKNPRKRDLAQAALRLGPRRIGTLACSEMAVCLALCGWASILLGRALVVVTMAAIIAGDLAYNLEPVRLKRRGFASPVTVGVCFGFLPCVLSHAAVTGDFPARIWPIYAGLGLSVAARALWWTVPDARADAAAGTVTVVVRLGARRMAALSCAVALGLPVLLGWGLWWSYGPGWAAVGVVAASAWFFGQFAGLRDMTSRSYAELRRLFMTPMAAANIVFALLPLLAQGLRATTA